MANVYITRQIQSFLSTPMPSTGLPPHFYITADKSTNHRVTNQVSMVCPVVDGERKAIPLATRQVYEDSSGHGGLGDELAEKLFEDLDKHAKIGKDNPRLMQAQGKVFDGQYLTRPFIQAMNEPIKVLLSGNEINDLPEDPTDDFWWPAQWDPTHWLNLVFEKFRGEEFVARLLSHTNLVHRQFGHRKLHSVSKATAADLDLLFQVTVSFATQRFMSSSYQQFLKLEKSLAVYIETFRDHDNTKITEYKIAGTNFVYDLLGTIDLLWPLALLMIQGQLEWCPVWKFPSWIPLLEEQLHQLAEGVIKDDPAHSACPRLYEHGKSIQCKKYGDVDLVDGWLIVQDKEIQNRPMPDVPIVPDPKTPP